MDPGAIRHFDISRRGAVPLSVCAIPLDAGLAGLHTQHVQCVVQLLGILAAVSARRVGTQVTQNEVIVPGWKSLRVKPPEIAHVECKQNLDLTISNLQSARHTPGRITLVLVAEHSATSIRNKTPEKTLQLPGAELLGESWPYGQCQNSMCLGEGAQDNQDF